MNKSLLVISGMFLFMGAAFGEEEVLPPVDIFSTDIEQLVNIKVERIFSASKVEERLSNAPASVTIVTSYEIKVFGYRTLADVLKAQKGFYITYDRNYNYAGVRGFYKAGDYNSRILLLIDGHQINDNIYDQAFIGTDFLLDVDLIERIEIVRGPVSSIYGGNGLFGVINVITRRPNKNEFSLMAGSLDTYQGRLTLLQNLFDGGYVMGSTTYYQSHGGSLYYRDFDSPDIGDGRNYRGDYDKFPSFFVKTVFEDFVFSGGYIWRKKGIPTGAWGTVFNDKRNFSIDERAFFDLKYQHMLDNGMDLVLRLFVDKYGYRGNYVYPDEIQSETNYGECMGAEIKGTYSTNSLTLTMGGEIRDNFRQNMQINGTSSGALLDFRHSSLSSGVYVGGIWSISSYLGLNLSLRYDYFEFYDDGFSGRLAVLLHPYRDGTYKVIMANSFRPPNIYERYYNDNNMTQKSPLHLHSEIIRQAEVVYEHSITAELTSSFSLYFSDIYNLIGFDIDPVDDLIVARNIDSIQITGSEGSISYLSSKGIAGEISYLYSYFPKKNGAEIRSYPSHMAKTRIAYPFFNRRVTPAISFNYISDRDTLRGRRLDPVFLADLNINLYLIKDFELSFGVYNLFDQKYYDVASVEHTMDAIEQDGITFRIKVVGRF